MAKKKDDRQEPPADLSRVPSPVMESLRGALVPVEDEVRLRENTGQIVPPQIELRPSRFDNPDYTPEDLAADVAAGRKPMVRFDDERKQRFVELLSMYGVKSKCAKAVGISPHTAKEAQRRDPEFAEACDMAMEVFTDSLEETIIDRAVHGWVEPVVSGGVIVGYVKKFDNRLLELLLKRHIPAYRDKQQLDVNVNGGVMLAPAPMSSPEEWQNKHKQDSLPQETSRDMLGSELKKVVNERAE